MRVQYVSRDTFVSVLNVCSLYVQLLTCPLVQQNIDATFLLLEIQQVLNKCCFSLFGYNLLSDTKVWLLLSLFRGALSRYVVTSFVHLVV
jgi:hypothetical protein